MAYCFQVMPNARDMLESFHKSQFATFYVNLFQEINHCDLKSAFECCMVKIKCHKSRLKLQLNVFCILKHIKCLIYNLRLKLFTCITFGSNNEHKSGNDLKF